MRASAASNESERRTRTCELCWRTTCRPLVCTSSRPPRSCSLASVATSVRASTSTSDMSRAVTGSMSPMSREPLDHLRQHLLRKVRAHPHNPPAIDSAHDGTVVGRLRGERLAIRERIRTNTEHDRTRVAHGAAQKGLRCRRPCSARSHLPQPSHDHARIHRALIPLRCRGGVVLLDKTQ